PADAAERKDDAFLQQARIDVVRALAASALFDHHGDQAQALRLRHVGLVVVSRRSPPRHCTVSRNTRRCTMRADDGNVGAIGAATSTVHEPPALVSATAA